MMTAGGGGWGDPFAREPERVRTDVIEGYVTIDDARAVYGVVLDAQTHAIDDAATSALRRNHRAASVGDRS
jgi:N-methylhydantoinase B